MAAWFYARFNFTAPRGVDRMRGLREWRRSMYVACGSRSHGCSDSKRGPNRPTHVEQYAVAATHLSCLFPFLLLTISHQSTRKNLHYRSLLLHRPVAMLFGQV